jgi:hypothetical protein
MHSAALFHCSDVGRREEQRTGPKALAPGEILSVSLQRRGCFQRETSL